MLYRLGVWQNASRPISGGDLHEEEAHESHTGHHPANTAGRERTADRPGYANFTADRSQISRDSERQGYLEKGKAQPGEAELLEALGPGVQAPKQASTVEPYREAIQDWLKQGVEMTAIWLRLRENFGYKGGYSSIRRYVHRLEPRDPEAFVRVHSEPGEDMQVDLGRWGSCTIR